MRVGSRVGSRKGVVCCCEHPIGLRVTGVAKDAGVRECEGKREWCVVVGCLRPHDGSPRTQALDLEGGGGGRRGCTGSEYTQQGATLAAGHECFCMLEAQVRLPINILAGQNERKKNSPRELEEKGKRAGCGVQLHTVRNRCRLRISRRPGGMA